MLVVDCSFLSNGEDRCQITPYLPLPRKHSPNSTSQDWDGRHLIAADWRRIYFRNHSLMSYSDDYVSVDLAITFVILDTLNIFLIDFFSDWLLLIYIPRQDERLSWPGCWLIADGLPTVVDHRLSASAVGRAQDTESLLAKDRRSTTVPRNQLPCCMHNCCVFQ